MLASVVAVAAPVSTRDSQPFLVLGLCFATIVFDGYDLIVYGSVVPELLQYEPWGLTPQRVGSIGSLALAGMLIGALGVGALTDLVGRRKASSAASSGSRWRWAPAPSRRAPAYSPSAASWPALASAA
jgi:MFS family permease